MAKDWKKTTIDIWHDGDRSVGISGDRAEILMYMPVKGEDEDYIAAVKECLGQAFTNLWDFKVHIDIHGRR